MFSIFKSELDRTIDDANSLDYSDRKKIADFLDDEITNGFSLDNNLKGRYGRATFQRQQTEHLGKSVDWIKWALAESYYHAVAKDDNEGTMKVLSFAADNR